MTLRQSSLGFLALGLVACSEPVEWPFTLTFEMRLTLVHYGRTWRAEIDTSGTVSVEMRKVEGARVVWVPFRTVTLSQSRLDGLREALEHEGFWDLKRQYSANFSVTSESGEAVTRYSVFDVATMVISLMGNDQSQKTVAVRGLGEIGTETRHSRSGGTRP